MQRRELLIGAGALLSAGLPTLAWAQAGDYPKPGATLRYVVPFPPGGLTDVMARLVGQQLGERWKVSVVIDNKPGNGGQIGADVVAKSPPDGNTLLAITLTHAANVTLFAKAPFNFGNNSPLPPVDMSIIKTAPSSVQVGTNLDFTFAVKNNSASPRLFAEIFNRVNATKEFLSIDSSVMNIFSDADKSLPREWVTDADGREKFSKYLPFPAFSTTIENYPYPYVIGKLCWEFPGAVPSDWEAQNLRGSNHPATVADWKSALDATVLKQGAMNFIFHPHGWIRPDQMVEFVDYAVTKYGKKVKFLNFREADERLFPGP